MARRARPAEPRRPLIYIAHGPNEDLRQAGCHRWSYYAATFIRFVDRDDPAKRSRPLTFRLDTGAFASALPEEWVREFDLARSLGPLSAAITVGGVAGTTSGPLARGARVELAGVHEQTYLFDFLVLASLNRRPGQEKEPFGVIALRDIANNFLTIKTQGEFTFNEEGRPVGAPDLLLVPR